LTGTWVIPPFLIRYAFFWCPEKDSKFNSDTEIVGDLLDRFFFFKRQFNGINFELLAELATVH